MIYYLIIIPLIIYAYIAPKFIRKYRYLHYIVAGVLAVIGGASEGFNFINEGFLGLSFFIIVMFTGALSQGKMKKSLMTTRAVYAIIGYILISAHALSYLLYIIDEDIFFSHIVIPIGLAIYLLFLPLFITSFSIVRKYFSFKTWKKLHRFSYLGYTLLFLHLYLLDNSRSIFYLGLFSVYVVFRGVQVIDKYFTKKKINKIKEEKLIKTQL